MLERPIILHRDAGIGNINYQEPASGGGAPPGFINVAGAEDGLSVNPGQFIVLGQTIGQVGSPAKLLEPREIPLNGNQLNFLTKAGANLEIASGGVAQLFDPGSTGQQFVELITIQGKLPGPNHFGNFQIGWLEQNFVNPDGQIDAVMTTGYNTDGADGKLNPLEASFATVLESHFQQGGVGNGTFEYYLTSDTIGGTIARHMFLVVDKITGAATVEWTLNNFELADTASAGGAVYATLNDAGLSLVGKTNMTVDIKTQTPAADGGLRIQPQVGSNGTTSFVDTSGVATGFFNFLAAAVFSTSNFANGFANYWFQSSAAAGFGFIFINTVVDPNSPLFAIHNTGYVSVFKGLAVGTFNTAPVASALIDLESTTQGFLTSRMTTVQKLAIATPAEGLQVYDLTLHQMSYFNGTTWINF